jgi:enoyl-CoA hydratase/carnithine racemase
MWDGLARTLEGFGRDDDICIVVLTSAGRDRLAGFSKPTIARIRGYCLGWRLRLVSTAKTIVKAVPRS